MAMGEQEKPDERSISVNPERQEISQLVKCRMQSLGQPLNDYGTTET